MKGRLAAAALLFCCAAWAQPRRIVPLGSGGKRVALVVGNDSYRSLPKLTNGVRDARAVAASLTSAGFHVTPLTNATFEALEEGVNRFIADIQPGDVALFYYSGHAVQIGAENYLSPVDLVAANAVQARGRSLRAGEVVEEMESRGADLQIVILDACRDNPFGRERGIGSQGGLTAMNGGKGTFLAYATAPGKTADDNSGAANGLYTTYLVEALKQPGLSIEQVFKQVSGQVQRASSGKQVPWVSSSLEGEFYFRLASAGSSVSSNGMPDATAEAWALVKDSQHPEDFDSFAQMFSSSDLARTAQLRAAQLRRGAAAIPPSLSQPSVSPAGEPVYSPASTIEPPNSSARPPTRSLILGEWRFCPQSSFDKDGSEKKYKNSTYCATYGQVFDLMEDGSGRFAVNSHSVSVRWALDGNQISIEYQLPAIIGRKVVLSPKDRIAITGHWTGSSIEDVTTGRIGASHRDSGVLQRVR